MPFTLAQFVKLRPFAWHLTARSNLPLIQRSRTLVSAERLAGPSTMLREPRRDVMPVKHDGQTVLLRDQKPLRAEQTIFEGGWGIDDLLAAVNGHVFFWPGNADAPIAMGRNHFRCYAGDVALRVPMPALLAANGEPKFCAFNSGAPSARARSRRGPTTFATAHAFERTAGAVKELVFEHTATLPTFEIIDSTPA
ncbi:MAG: hypothetical protein AAGD32_08880 [Planctomycetota bacterium]